MRILSILCVVPLLSLAAGQASAHHSFASFDEKKSMQIIGTVREVQYTNPHAWLFVAVAGPKGHTETWAIEAGAVNILLRLGWKPNTIKVGDKVKVLLHPMHDPKKRGGSLMGVVLPDGRTIGDKF